LAQVTLMTRRTVLAAAPLPQYLLRDPCFQKERRLSYHRPLVNPPLPVKPIDLAKPLPLPNPLLLPKQLELPPVLRRSFSTLA
jgi:hypothetical protein